MTKPLDIHPKCTYDEDITKGTRTMTYSEMQNVAEDGAERHQAEVKTGLAKMYAEGSMIFPEGWREKLDRKQGAGVPLGWEDGAL